jgi:hypothetical protein
VNIDPYTDLDKALVCGTRVTARNTPFIRAGKFLHNLYRKGIEDALAFYIHGVVYIVHSDLKNDDDAFSFCDKEDFKDLSVDTVLSIGRQPEDDVTADCLNAFSSRFFG